MFLLAQAVLAQWYSTILVVDMGWRKIWLPILVCIVLYIGRLERKQRFRLWRRLFRNLTFRNRIFGRLHKIYVVG